MKYVIVIYVRNSIKAGEGEGGGGGAWHRFINRRCFVYVKLQFCIVISVVGLISLLFFG